MPSTIAVGVDGSAPSLVALRWALHAATGRSDTVIAVIARPPSPDRQDRQDRQDRTREPARPADQRNASIGDHITEVRQAIDRAADGASVLVEVLDGSPTQVLLTISGRVRLLVVGGHGYHGWREAVTPSVAGQLAVHTQSALCVVRTIPQPTRGRIVVGHDGVSSVDAVRFAAAEAEARGACLLMVSTWHYPRDTRATSSEAAIILQEGAAAALAEMVADIRLTHPGLTIDTEVRLGHPVEELADLAASSDMVVVGSHGRGALATLVIGSVAIGLLRRVGSPVVIVPHGR